MPPDDTTTTLPVDITTTTLPVDTTTTTLPVDTTTTTLPVDTTTTTLPLEDLPVGVPLEEMQTMTVVGHNTSTWSNITFGDILGSTIMFIVISIIALTIFRMVAMFRRYNRTR